MRFSVAILFWVIAAGAASAQSVHWVQLGPGGAAEIRAVAEGSACPVAVIDGGPYQMAQRATADGNFPQPVCALTLPPNVQSATLAGERVPIPKTAPQRILVIGDLMLDEFIWGKVSRISPEAPVPVVNVTAESYYPGGAANVARNVREFTARTAVLGVAGCDGQRISWPPRRRCWPPRR